jgi:hypothetical protein
VYSGRGSRSPVVEGDWDLRPLKGGAEVSLPRGRGSEAEARTMRESAMRYIFPEECMRTDACMHMTR